MKPTKDLEAQIKAIEHAIDVLVSDEEVLPGLMGAKLALQWTNKHQATVRAAASVALMPGGVALMQSFIALSRSVPDFAELMPVFAHVYKRHPEIIALLQEFGGEARVVEAAPVTTDAERAHAHVG